MVTQTVMMERLLYGASLLESIQHTHLHVELILELRPLEALVQQALSDLSPLLLVQGIPHLPHVLLDAGEHLDSPPGVVIVQLQK